MFFPEVAGRSCADCQKYLYRDTPGKMGLPLFHGGQRVERLPGQTTPCRYCPKIPLGLPARPSSAIQLSERNAAAYLHYRRCKAVGRFPFDAIVERNAAYILQVEDEARDEKGRVGQIEDLTAMLAAMRK